MYQVDFTKAELKKRRDLLCEQVGDATVLLAGAPASMGPRFRQFNDFYYLCGVEVPHAYLAIDGKRGRTTLFLPREDQLPRDDDYPLICGDSPAYALESTGVDDVCGLDALQPYLSEVSVVFTHFQDGESAQACLRSINGARKLIEADPWDAAPSRGARFAGLIKERCPSIEVRDVAKIIRRMRMIKSAREIEMLRRAGELSAIALKDAIQSTRPGVMEYQLAAVMRYHYNAGGGNDIGYSAIVGGGVNAFHGHYSINNCAVNAGDLVLGDCAPDYRYYTSDITRCWPVNGRFSPAQRTMYQFLGAFHTELLNAIRPGRMITEIEEEVAAVMESRLGEFEFATAAQAGGARWALDFKKHLAHCVGMACHDGCLHKLEPLQPGMVFSVDPQFKVVSERIYLRIEDVGVVTEDGFDVFTNDVPYDVDAIEALMQRDGILQLFPPLADLTAHE